MAAEPQHRFTDPAPLRVVEALDPAFARLDALASLEPGWDSYDADPIAPVAIKTARGLLMLSVAELRDIISEPTQLDVLPLVDGGVQVEWRSSSGDLEIEIQRDGTLSYLYVEHQPGERFHERDGVAVDEILERLREMQAQHGNPSA